MTLRLKGSKLKTEVDKCRAECNWKGLGATLTPLRSAGTGRSMEQLADLFEAECIIETFIEKHGNSVVLTSFSCYCTFSDRCK